ncbi:MULTISPECIES: hypothetical protein [Marinilabiliaceae]|uniref:Outer membrane protein beta-barrel domain-containing protein n=2 Tax=Marinilabiliaceae TaxID=558415 RepID=A0A1T5HSQ0_9BACT|nr:MULTISPECIES: hypothetical protein [Marinilabiliaceae]ASB49223.1 hypothetical protein CDL62_08770 [Alkalitalea saponilacus]TCO08397.1 hypothetical protein EV194_105201 [Natronoflexus pectinivorans]SKC23706.1 hypothetical protein SAMN03080601_02991 [Alkalitalea saponilacus]
MKKAVFVILACMLIIPAVSNAQGRAIGLRFGGGNLVGAEISYQTPFNGDRLELDLGIKSSSHWSHWSLTGIYQWVWQIEGGFYWYAGVGPSIGNRSYSGPGYRDDGMFLAAALNAGVEYNFEEIPLQLSVDIRPELGLINTYDRGVFSLALGVRYRF